MAVAFVQDWTAVIDAATPATISGTALTAGNWAVAVTRSANTATITPPSPFTSVLSKIQSGVKVEVFVGLAVGGETSFDFGYDAGASASVSLTEFTNILAASPVDVSASAGANGVTSQVTGTTGTTAQADSMAVACIAWAATVTSPSCATGFTLGSYSASAMSGIAYKVLSATGTQNGTWSWTTARDTAAAIIVLKGLVPSGHPTAARFNQHPYSWGRKPNRSYR